MSGDDSDDEWRFSVEEFEDSPSADGDSSGPGSPAHSTAEGTRSTDDASENRRAERDGDPGGEDANVAGEFSPSVQVAPEIPNLESAVFVTIGAILTVIALGALVGGASFGTFDVLTIVVVVAALGAATYVVLVRLTPDT